MIIQVKLFAIIRDIVGSDELIIELPENSRASNVLEKIIQEHPQVAEWKDVVRLAVNCEYVLHEHRIFQNDEVAVIPPVSGG